MNDILDVFNSNYSLFNVVVYFMCYCSIEIEQFQILKTKSERCAIDLLLSSNQSGSSYEQHKL